MEVVRLVCFDGVDILSGAKDLDLYVWWSRMTFLFENKMYAIATPRRTLTAMSHLLRRRIDACKALLWSSSCV